jgi:hypothetical protein
VREQRFKRPDEQHASSIFTGGYKASEVKRPSVPPIAKEGVMVLNYFWTSSSMASVLTESAKSRRKSRQFSTRQSANLDHDLRLFQRAENFSIQAPQVPIETLAATVLSWTFPLDVESSRGQFLQPLL